MDYFGDVFHTFLGLDSVIYLAVNGTVTNLPVFIQNILNCVPKTNKAFTGLERHGGKWLMTIFILGWSNPLRLLHTYDLKYSFDAIVTRNSRFTFSVFYFIFKIVVTVPHFEKYKNQDAKIVLQYYSSNI